jgi:retron-type reverse transcriptase
MEPTVKKEDGRYAISMAQVTAAYKKVRSNRGAGGIDGMSWEEFDKQHKELLYKLWNRMTSGSYSRRQPEKLSYPKLVVAKGG